jgi:hypothetical protein
MAKNNKNKPTTNPDWTPRQENDAFSDLYSSEIVKAFSEKMEKKNSSFLSVASKEKTIQEFEKFVKEEYDDNILQALKEGKIAGESIDVELNKIIDKGFTLDDLLSPTKSTVIKNKLWHMTSESDAISHGIVQCHKQRSNLTQETKDVLKFDDFLREVGYQSKTDPEGNMISVSPWPKGKKQSLSSIHTLWKDFVRNKIHDTENIALYTDMMSFDHFDPTEKVASISAVRGLHHQISQISKWNKQKEDTLMDTFTDIFGPDVLYNPIGASTSWTSIEWLERHIADFFRQIASTGVVTKKDIEQLKNLSVSTKSCAMIGEKTGDLPRWVYDEQLKNKRFSELSDQMKQMVNTFAQVDLVNNVSDAIESFDTEIEHYGRVFDIPGNMASFFDQFGSPSTMEIDKNSHEYKLHEAEYKRKRKELSDFVALHRDALDSDAWVQAQKEALEQEVQELQLKINPHGAYLSLKQQKERIKDQLWDTTDPIQKQNLTKQLADIDLQMTQAQQTTQVSTRDQYFDHIADQVDTSISVVGSWVVHGAQIRQILQKLKDSNRDISKLSHPDEQNILMQASINIQLMKVKESDITTTIGYGFQEYAAFVSGLYDLRLPSQSIIMTKDQEPITLDFTSKKFVGKPLERHNVDVADVSDLSSIRVEFELDLNNNPDAEEFVRIMTGGNRSQLIEDFLPWAKGKDFPKTITDSSFVKMIDKDGVLHEWYLSRYEFPDDEDTHERPEWSSPQAENSTYILYSEPADTLSTTREVKTRWEKDEHGKKKPVYINLDNIDDWKSVEIKDKKVRLSDQHLKALTLGHMVAGQTTKKDLLNPQNPKIAEAIAQADAKYTSELEKSHRDISQDTNKDWDSVSATSDTSESSAFLSERNMLVGGADKKILCEPWARFAVEPPEQAINSVPPSPQLLSAIVKEVKRDPVTGDIVGCTLWFETLSRGGTCAIKDVTLTGSQLSNLKQVFGSVTYLDNIQKNPQDYTAIMDMLQKSYDDKKKYNWNIFSDLKFDGKEFLKWKEKVTKFVAAKATGDAYGKWNDKYDVEYTIKKVGEKYHITSSPYAADIVTKKWEEKKSTRENISFDTTTDLAGMLLILAGKKLKPYTKIDEENTAYADIKDGTVPTRSSKNRSFSTIWSVIKWWWKAAIEWLKKKWWWDQEDELKQILFNEMNLYRKISDGPIGKLLAGFDLDVFDDLADEAEASGMEYGWKKINGYYEQLLKFHPAWNTGVRNGGLAIAKDLMKWAVASYKANKTCSYKDRLKTAGSLLYVLEKMKSWYSKDFAEYERWIFVKIMLGPQAYSIYEQRYNKLELESRDNSWEWYKKREQLMLLEYNFIVDSIRWWPNTDGDNVRSQSGLDPYMSSEKPNNPFYFQHLYSRKFAGELSNKVWGIKSIPTDTSNEDIKNLIDGNNFEHVYGECRDHIGQLRVSDAVKELVALQQVASTKEQADKVSMLILAGILNGAFVYNLWAETKMNLKWMLRNSSFPYPQVIEHFDAPQKIQALLSLSTGDLWDDSFASFQYGKVKSWVLQKLERSYNPDDFHATQKDEKWEPNNTKIEGFVHHFESRRKKNEDRVVPFLHMDAESLQSDNNLVKIWKSQDSQLKIYGKPVDPLAKKCVNEMMSELYSNRSRWADFAKYNYSSWLTHTATTIENFYRDSVNKYKWQDWEPAVWDHAGTIWASIEKNIPNTEEPGDRKDVLAYHVNEFFRVFQWFWGFDYEEWQIATFYKHLRLAQQYNEPDKSRLIRFYMTKQLFWKWPVPPVVEQSFTKYMQYFEKNLNNFDEKLWSHHNTPGNSDKTFVEAFTDSIKDISYMSQDKWGKMKIEAQRELTNKVTSSGERELLNRNRQDTNKTARWMWRYNNAQSNIQMSIDDKIVKLRWGMAARQWWSDMLDPTIDAKNKKMIDYSLIRKKKNTRTPYDLTQALSEMNPKNMTPEQLEEYKEEQKFKKNQMKYGTEYDLAS